jgi:hypothetical protein
MNMTYEYLQSEKVRNKVEGAETFDVNQFIAEFKELCDSKSAEARYRKQLSTAKNQESKIKEFLGIK